MCNFLFDYRIARRALKRNDSGGLSSGTRSSRIFDILDRLLECVGVRQVRRARVAPS